jgi:hypothetical protein
MTKYPSTQLPKEIRNLKPEKVIQVFHSRIFVSISGLKNESATQVFLSRHFASFFAVKKMNPQPKKNSHNLQDSRSKKKNQHPNIRNQNTLAKQHNEHPTNDEKENMDQACSDGIAIRRVGSISSRAKIQRRSTCRHPTDGRQGPRHCASLRRWPGQVRLPGCPRCLGV